MNQQSRICGISEVLAYLCVHDCQEAITYYENAFGAEEVFRVQDPDGRIGHVHLKMGASSILVSDEYPEMNILSPQTIGDTAITLHLHVENVDALTDQAVSAGAKVLQLPTDQFWGERTSRLCDPFGHIWLLGQHVEDVDFEEIQARRNKSFES